MFIELGRLSGKDGSTKEFEADFLREISSWVPNAVQVSFNFINSEGVIVAPHIVEVPPPPLFNYVAVVATSDIPADSPNMTPKADMPMRLSVKRYSSQIVREHSATEWDAKRQVVQLCFIKRRKGMSMEDFRNHYENVHAPLALCNLPMISSYNRYFVNDPAANDEIGQQELDFDVVTEFTFATADDHARFHRKMADPAIGEIFAEDEKNLFDRSKISLFLVRQKVVSLSGA